MTRCILFACLSVAWLLPDLTLGQSIVTSPVTLNLQPEPFDNTMVGGMQFYKYGIYASLGGSMSPQLYEFDTGAPGFYAVYSTNPAYDSSAWGTNFTFVSTNGNMSYVSSNNYTGTVQGTSVSLYSANGQNGYASNPVISTGANGSTNIWVGQVSSIVNSKSGVVSWPGNTPPVDGYFYGDFGAGLAYTNNGVMNLLAQLNYANGVIPGFIISLGASGSTNPTLQIGISSTDLAAFPYQFQINGLNSSNHFPVALGSTNVIPTYATGVINATYSYGNGTNVPFTTNGGVVLDTGASGFQRNDTNANPDPLAPFISSTVDSQGKTNFSISDGVTFSLSLTNSNNIALDYSAMTGTNTGNISFGVLSGSNYAINVGQDLFHQYNVAYDLQDGIIAFQPIAVPEPQSLGFLIMGSLTFLVINRLKRWLTLPKRS